MKVVSQTRSHGDEIVKACLYGFAGGESIKVPVRGGGFLVAEVPQLDSEVWLEDNCVEFIVPPEEKQEPEEKNEQGQEEVQTIEEVHKNAEELYKKRLAAAGGQMLATSADEELDSKNFAKVKEQKGNDIYDQERRKYDRSKKLKEGNKEYGECGHFGGLLGLHPMRLLCLVVTRLLRIWQRNEEGLMAKSPPLRWTIRLKVTLRSRLQ